MLKKLAAVGLIALALAGCATASPSVGTSADLTSTQKDEVFDKFMADNGMEGAATTEGRRLAKAFCSHADAVGADVAVNDLYMLTVTEGRTAQMAAATAVGGGAAIYCPEHTWAFKG